HGMLVAGTNGVALLHDSGLEMLSFADASSGQGVGGMVESRNGDLWLNSMRGVVRISASELDLALTRPGYRMKSDVLTEGNFIGASRGVYRSADAARDADGNLWFETLNGVMHIDPRHWRPDNPPPTLAIRSLTVDGHPIRDDGIIA